MRSAWRRNGGGTSDGKQKRAKSMRPSRSPQVQVFSKLSWPFREWGGGGGGGGGGGVDKKPTEVSSDFLGGERYLQSSKGRDPGSASAPLLIREEEKEKRGRQARET